MWCQGSDSGDEVCLALMVAGCTVTIPEKKVTMSIDGIPVQECTNVVSTFTN